MYAGAGPPCMWTLGDDPQTVIYSKPSAFPTATFTCKMEIWTSAVGCLTKQ